MRPHRRRPLTAALQPMTRHGKGPAAVASEIDDLRMLGLTAARAARRDRDGVYLTRRARTDVYRWIWQDAASRLGGAVHDEPGGFLRIEADGSSFRVFQQLVPVDDPVVLRFAGDKPATHEALLRAGLAVPPHLDADVRDLDRLWAFVGRHGPCVVKPSRGGGSGHGVTGGVTTRDDLVRAVIRATRWDPHHVLVESQIRGREVRALVLDGEVLGMIQRDRPTVTGDGRATVMALLRQENARRVNARGFAGIVPLRPTLDADLALRPQGLRFSSVPAPGERVEVATATSASSERESTTVSDARLEAVATRAARAVGARLSSVEIITGDPDVGAPTVVEVNTTPGLAHHYLVRDRATAVPVAAHLARRLLDLRITAPA